MDCRKTKVRITNYDGSGGYIEGNHDEPLRRVMLNGVKYLLNVHDREPRLVEEDGRKKWIVGLNKAYLVVRDLVRENAAEALVVRDAEVLSRIERVFAKQLESEKE